MKVNLAMSHVVPDASTKIPPARAARDAIAAQPDLGEQPFGKLVSQYARGTVETPSGE